MDASVACIPVQVPRFLRQLRWQDTFEPLATTDSGAAVMPPKVHNAASHLYRTADRGEYCQTRDSTLGNCPRGTVRH